jgi:hypothetical protein
VDYRRAVLVDEQSKQCTLKEVVCELIQYPERQAESFSQVNDFVIGSCVAFQQGF